MYLKKEFSSLKLNLSAIILISLILIGISFINLGYGQNLSENDLYQEYLHALKINGNLSASGGMTDLSVSPSINSLDTLDNIHGNSYRIH